MELFEKAHVVKNKDSSRKESKNEENVKKKLKQMLYGFKQSDNQLIKNSANIDNDFEDSSSVSGFSDLNLTNSSLEADVTDSVGSVLEGKEHKDPEFNESVTRNLSKTNDNDSTSISEYTYDLHSLSTDLDDNSSVSSLALSLDSSNIESYVSDIESSTSEQFDPDGALANKILEKLNKMESKVPNENKEDKLPKKKEGTKRKLIENKDLLRKKSLQDISMEDDCLSDSNEDVTSEKTHTMTIKPAKYLGPYRPNDSQSDHSIENDDFVKESENQSVSSESNISGDSLSIASNIDSPLYVSVVAADMPSQSLGEVLGEYKYSTIKNLPSGCQSKVNPNNSGIFSPGSLENVHINEGPEDFLSEIDNDMENTVNALNESINDVDLDSTEVSTIPNESTTNDTTFQSEEQSEIEDSMESEDIPFENPVEVYYGKNRTCIFVLKHPAEIYIYGKAKLQCLGGIVEIYGYTLQEKTYEVFAPNYNYALCLKTIANDNAYYGLFSKLTSTGLTVAEAEDIVTTIGKHDCVISMQPLNSRKIDFVENSSSVSSMFRLNKNIDNCFSKASGLLCCSLYLSKPWKCLQVNASWKEVVTCGLENHQSKGIVCGGKGVGKSTFLRYYINKMLAKGPVLLIDLDPGQCEMTVAGNMSATVIKEPLFGPNFTHLQNPNIMLNLGMINTMDNTKRYTNAIQQLINHCSEDEHLSNMPWIVNTMGMCNNMGLKLMAYIIINIKPTFLFQIDSKNPKKRFESHLYSYTVKCLHREYKRDSIFRNVHNVDELEYQFFISLPSENSSKNGSPLAPRDERYLNFLAYFGQLIRGNSLLEILPYEVNINDFRYGSNVSIPDGDIAKVINGKVVALCQQAGDSRLFTLTDKPLRCFGHGVIRGIDLEKGKLYIITPTPVDVLHLVNTLVYADWVPELRGQERGLPPGIAIPYRTASEYHQRQLMFTPKRRFNPVQLIKMLRNT